MAFLFLLFITCVAYHQRPIESSLEYSQDYNPVWAWIWRSFLYSHPVTEVARAFIDVTDVTSNPPNVMPNALTTLGVSLGNTLPTTSPPPYALVEAPQRAGCAEAAPFSLPDRKGYVCTLITTG
jgi:hypothetical protein